MKKILWLVMGFLAPIATFAQINTGAPQDAWSLLGRGQNLMNLLIKVLVGFAIVMIIIGVVRFIMAGASGDEDASKKAKSTILYGILGLFVITTIWGLVGIVKRTLGTNTTETFQLPCVPGASQNC